MTTGKAHQDDTEADREDRLRAALDMLFNLGWVLPPGHGFDREEANQRGA